MRLARADSGLRARATQMNMLFDLLIGRKTFEIWAKFWPQHTSKGVIIVNYERAGGIRAVLGI